MGNKSLSSDNEITIDQLDSMLNESSTSDYMGSYLNNERSVSDVSTDIDGGKGGRVKSKKHKKRHHKLVDNIFDYPPSSHRYPIHHSLPNTPSSLTLNIKNLSQLYTPYEITSSANLQPLFNPIPSATPVTISNPNNPSDKQSFVYAMVPMLIPQQWANK
jgi:hypothetical protein